MVQNLRVSGAFLGFSALCLPPEKQLQRKKKKIITSAERSKKLQEVKIQLFGLLSEKELMGLVALDERAVLCCRRFFLVPTVLFLPLK